MWVRGERPPGRWRCRTAGASRARCTTAAGTACVAGDQDECRIPASAGAEVVPDVVLAPCVGFTASGYRLGYGGGYFDRWLDRHPQATAIGVAWSASEIDEAELRAARARHRAHAGRDRRVACRHALSGCDLVGAFADRHARGARLRPHPFAEALQLRPPGAAAP